MAQSLLLDNLDILTANVPDNLYNSLLSESQEIANSKNGTVHTSGLSSTGVAEHFRVTTSKEYLEEFILELISQYQSSHYLTNLRYLDKSAPYVFRPSWFNFQTQGQFVPNHTHEGVLSFVIWLQVPSDIKNDEFSGKFEFTYCDILGNTRPYQIAVDSNAIGRCMLFPAGLRHCVYPFYNSSQLRISVAGSIVLGN